MTRHVLLPLLLLAAALGACSSTRSRPGITGPSTAETSPDLRAAPTAEPAGPVVPTGGGAPPVAVAASPPCPSPETFRKAKPKPKSHPIHKEEPRPVPPSPPVAQAPAGGVVDTEVKPTSVPVATILGKLVKSPTGEDLGRVVDVLADSGGRVRAAIIDFGGFLGVGNRHIAVDWALLRFNSTGGEASPVLMVARDRLKSAPEYKGAARPQALIEASPAAFAPAWGPRAPAPATVDKP